MAVGFVNGINSTTAQSSLATSWSVTAGNLLLVCVYDDTGSLRNVSSDSQGNTYTLVGSAGGYNCAQNVYACIAGSSGVVTVNVTGAADVIAITEWSGVQLVADAPYTNSVGNQDTNTCSITVPTAGDLIIGSINTNYYSGAFTETGTNVVYYRPVANKGCIVSWQTGAAGTFTFNTVESSGGNNSLVVIALKASGGGAAPIKTLENTYRQRRS